MQVPCGEIEINNILGCTYKYKNDIDEMMKVKIIDNIKERLSPMIGILAPSFSEEGAVIKKKKMNVLTRFWFGFYLKKLDAIPE